MAIRVYRNASGQWACRPYLGTSAVTGKPLRPYKSFPEAKSESEARQLAQAWVNKIAAAASMHSRQVMSELLDTYIDEQEMAGLFSAATAKTYRSMVRCYITPYLGNKDPRSVKSYEVQNLYHTLVLSGGKRSGRGISTWKVRALHWFLSGAFNWMCKRGVCEENPLTAISAPRSVSSEATALDFHDYEVLLETLMKTLEDGSLGIAPGVNLTFDEALAMLISLETGARCGECLAIMRSDIWVMTSQIHIAGTVTEACGPPRRQPYTKGRRSRNVPMSKHLLRYVQKGCGRIVDKAQNGGASVSMQPLCGTSKGYLLRPSKLSVKFKQLMKYLHLSRLYTFHSLRHTHASILLAEGMDWRSLQEHLGHADPATTLRIYAHLMPGRNREAATIMERVSGQNMRGGDGHWKE